MTPCRTNFALRQIVDGISALVAVLTADGAVEIVNRQVLDYFGKTLEEVRGWSGSSIRLMFLRRALNSRAHLG